MEARFSEETRRVEAWIQPMLDLGTHAECFQGNPSLIYTVCLRRTGCLYNIHFSDEHYRSGDWKTRVLVGIDKFKRLHEDTITSPSDENTLAS